MERRHLEIAMLGIIRQQLIDARQILEAQYEHFDIYIDDLVTAMQRAGLGKALGNMAESFAIGTENQIGIRAVIAGYTVPADEDKPIAIKLEADNNTLTGVQLAMLRGQTVDLTGCQGELFAACDLGIHVAPQYDMFEEAVA